MSFRLFPPLQLHWNLTGLRTSVLGAGNAFWMHRTSSNIPMNNSTLAVGGPFSIAGINFGLEACFS